MSFYSPIDRLASESDRVKGTGADFMTELSNKPGYKQAEVDDRDLQTLMILPKMAKADFMTALANKPARIPKAQQLESTYHEDYTLPGGTNYREILLQDPGLNYGGKPEHFGGAPNVLASIRAKDRTGPNKERILHLEEIQSDLHQTGRKKGYQPKGEDAFGQARKAKAEHMELSRQLAQARIASDQAEAGLASDKPLYQNPDVKARLRKTQEASNRAIMDLMPQVMKADEAHRKLYETATQSVPDAPYKKNWHELALKRMIHHAAKQGYDEIHITPGEEQAKRYGLVGDKAKGMSSFYDNMLPSFLNKFGKKYNVQVGQGYVNTSNPNGPSQTAMLRASGIPEQEWGSIPYAQKEQMLADYAAKQPPSTTAVHSFRMTPEMRADVLKNGMSLYAEGGEVDDYHGEHKAPNAKTYGAYLHDLTGIMPKDIYTQKGKNTYGSNDTGIDNQWWGVAMRAKGKPDYEVEIHRAAPKHAKSISSGDWVTTSRKYAENHGESALGGNYKILSKKVKAKHLSTAGDPQEYGYHSDEPNITKAKGGVVSRETVKPVARGIIKEQITVSPSQDVMRYELMGLKRSSKKVK